MKMALRDDIRALDRVEDLFRDLWSGRLAEWRPPVLSRLGQSFAPSSDVFNRGDDLVARVELPGIDPLKDLTVEVIDGELVVRGSRHETEEVKQEDYYRKEVWHGSYERRIPLPKGTTDDAVSAEYDRGVLQITVRGGARSVDEPPAPKATTIVVKIPSKSTDEDGQ